MAKGKKYDVRIVQKDKTWIAEITRKISSKETVVSNSQDGFATEKDAQAWAEKELKTFMEKLAEQNKRHSEKRK